jgi:hypothetical protein
MGCSISVPEQSAFEEVHKVDTRIPLLGSPSTDYPTLLTLRENLFSWSNGYFPIKTVGGAPFGKGMKIQGNIKNEMILLDGNNAPVAACLLKSGLLGQSFQIYSQHTMYPAHRSERKYNQHALYTYAKVEKTPLTNVVELTFESEPFPSYSVHRAGEKGQIRKLVVKRNGRPAALIESGTWEGDWTSYLLTINPGIDPCLIICLCIICDEMHEEKK